MIVCSLLNSVPLLEAASLYCIYYAMKDNRCLEYLIKGIYII